MSNTIVSVKTGRTARTAIQAAPSWVIVEAIDSFVYDMDDRQFGVAVLLLMLIGSYVMPIIENYSGRGLFRDVNYNTVPVTTEDETKPRS